MRKNTSGFTLVELLIVIVIIAILAAITIVAYNGVQQRAVNSQVLAAVSTYKKGLILYYGDNSAWPTPSANMVLSRPTCRWHMPWRHLERKCCTRCRARHGTRQ